MRVAAELSAAISVVPLPPKGSTITAPGEALDAFLDQLDREASLVAFVVRADVADLPEILQVGAILVDLELALAQHKDEFKDARQVVALQRDRHRLFPNDRLDQQGMLCLAAWITSMYSPGCSCCA